MVDRHHQKQNTKNCTYYCKHLRIYWQLIPVSVDNSKWGLKFHFSVTVEFFKQIYLKEYYLYNYLIIVHFSILFSFLVLFSIGMYFLKDSLKRIEDRIKFYSEQFNLNQTNLMFQMCTFNTEFKLWLKNRMMEWFLVRNTDPNSNIGHSKITWNWECTLSKSSPAS